MTTVTSRADRFAARLNSLPRGARAGLLALSIAAGFAVVGTGAAQAAPSQDAPAAWTVAASPPMVPIPTPGPFWPYR